ncbi:MAG: tol-pal system protein YbgF [Candidatus Dactylopiibacterium carminicum]|uniref:Cell division coordinator CpoB n=1 Tax=Candidatus Dactylopiibacterium carminicum TaxID=857335 RepID=A0A272ERT4_9RHOO|nr:tol-pal system protein YbgF [Candidatus Dactylopiibacterium carminicum]PAS92420.1 MAG: tol-pal system protein YbgF [Candidatus Dactylopiibacterium carminicum]PAS96023.1 MAG: tol-pal system protein YbgF [Candidatus Dactylopiibacterium carminicum]
MRALSLIILLVASLPAHALFGDDEARRRVEDLRQSTDARLQKLEATQEVHARSQIMLNAQFERLRQEVAEIRGQVEILRNDSDLAQKRQKDFYIDLDARLRKLETVLAQLNATPTQSAPGMEPAQEAKEYEAAIGTLRSGKHVDAIIALKQFIKNWPKSSFLPGAHFWAGSALLQAQDFASAKEYFAKVSAQWPDDILAADALLGQADAEQQLGDNKSTRATLDKLVAKYPSSDAGKTAKQRIAKLKK